MAERPPTRSLVTRVLFAVLAILFLGGLLVAGSMWLNGQTAVRRAYDQILLGAANDIAESIRILGGRPVADLPVSAFELLAQAPEDRIYYRVRGPEGEFITGLDAEMQIDGPARRGDAPVYFDARLNGEAARFIRVNRRFAERDFSGLVEIVVGQTLRARTAMMTDLMLNAILPMALAGLALVLVAWMVIRRALRPLEAITQGLSERDPHDLTPILPDRLPQELQVMIGAMNRFMGRLSDQFEGTRNLISDTAHQLRTPVAAIRVHAETAIIEPDGPARSRAMDRLLSRTRSLGTLLDQLLNRALVLHRSDSVPRAPVDLRDVALEIMERDDQGVLAPAVDLRLEIGEEPVMVRADAFSLQEAGRNLLGNAVAHGVPPVVIGAERRGAEAILWVRDQGPGPDQKILARLGERFNRNADSREGSNGIGLSIVQSVARAFGGAVEMTRDEKGFRAAIVLPTGGEGT
ncbi:sensor histidine kinase [Oceaniglobus trochenteri]|uniref:sensor histidine kinase n=1 Tax=Oceaniglobus trochenteri TaxID=2763260 RepID=UPI001CFFC4E3|nr:sensor histidine kinase [Oceaniglobus trochenteri]